MDDGSKMAPGVFAGIVRERLARDEGIAMERERVRVAIQEMLGGLKKAYDRDILETLAEDLGIDLRQPAGKGEG